MSVLVKGMEMPTSCSECRAVVYYGFYGYCGITKNGARLEARNADCPLISIPPHGRLIDADAFLAKCFDGTESNIRRATVITPSVMASAPTIIEAEDKDA